MGIKTILSILCMSRAILVASTEESITDHCYDAHKLEKPFGYYALLPHGVSAKLKEFPHLTAIGWKSDNRVNWGCGGSLITPKFILTAAHCCYKSVDGKKTAANVARMGTIELNLDVWDDNLKQKFTDNEDTAQEFEIIRIIPHPAYKSNRRYHDIALMELDRDAKINEFVIPICLWNKKNIIFTELESAGYGESEYGLGILPNLLKIKITQTEFEECKNTFPPDRRLSDGLIYNQHICANDKTNNDMDTCEGDSGGPLEFKLFSQNRQSLWIKVPVLAGVTSFGQAGCGSSAPGVYTRVSSYVDWIQAETKANLSLKTCIGRHTNLRELVSPPETHANNPPSTVHINGDKCLGVIIHERYVMTSSKCTKRTKPTTVQTRDKQQIDVEAVHENNGLALLKLKKDIKYSKRPYEELGNVGTYLYTVGPTCIADHIVKHQFEVIFDAKFKKSPVKLSQFTHNVSDCTTYHDVNETLAQNKYECSGGQWFAPNICQINPSSFGTVDDYYPRVNRTGLHIPIPTLKGFVQRHDSCGAILTRKITNKDLRWINQIIFSRVVEDKIYFEILRV